MDLGYGMDYRLERINYLVTLVGFACSKRDMD